MGYGIETTGRFDELDTFILKMLCPAFECALKRQRQWDEC